MSSMTGRLRGNLIRTGTAVAISVFALLTSLAPASAQVRVGNDNNSRWSRSDKSERKAAKKAARLGAPQSNSVVVGNGPVIDRSRTRRAIPAPPRRTTRNTYSNNDRGNRVYDYRNSNVDPYYTYPQYRRNQYGSYGNSGSQYGNYGNNYPSGYANSRYYDNREGDLDRREVAERGAQNGYNAGFQRGAYDAQQRNHANPSGHGAYQFGYDGFDPSWGSASTYQQAYRQYFVQGYNDGYSQRGNSRGYSRPRY